MSDGPPPSAGLRLNVTALVLARMPTSALERVERSGRGVRLMMRVGTPGEIDTAWGASRPSGLAGALGCSAHEKSIPKRMAKAGENFVLRNCMAHLQRGVPLPGMPGAGVRTIPRVVYSRLAR